MPCCSCTPTWDLAGLRIYRGENGGRPAMTELPEPLVKATERLGQALELYESGNASAALTVYDEVLAAYAHSGLTHGAMPAWAHHGRGAAFLALGKADDALVALARGLSLLGLPGGELDNLDIRAALLNTTGQTLRTLGRYRDASDAYSMALDLLRDHPGELLVATLSSVGALASHLGDTGRALTAYEEAFDVLEHHCPNSPSRVGVLVNLGGALRDAGQPDVAVGHLEIALDLSRRAGARRREADALLSLSRSYGAIDDYKAANDLANDAVETIQVLAPRSEMHARCLYQRAIATFGLEDTDRAIVDLRESVAIIESAAPVSPDAHGMRSGLAQYLVLTDSVDEAVDVAKAAVAAAERLRRQTASGLARRQVTATLGSAYDTLAFALLARSNEGDAEQLVEVLEARQARWLLDIVGVGEVQPTDRDDQQETLRLARSEARRLRQQLHRAQQALARGEPLPDGIDADQLRRLDAGARQQIQTVEAEIANEDDAAAVFDCSIIQARLKDRQALLYFSFRAWAARE